MKKIIVMIASVLSFALAFSSTSFAATGKEKDFIDAYKKAFEAKDEATLKSFLYTKGADPTILEFYTMMLTGEMGSKITSIELQDLTAEDIKHATEMEPLPSGEKAKLPFTPTKKLVLKIASGDANGSSTSSSESFVAEVDGKYMIPVPVPVK